MNDADASGRRERLMPIPRRNLRFERIWSFTAASSLAVWMIFLGAISILGIWMAEYFLVGTVFAIWVESRWYVIVAVFVLIGAVGIGRARERQLAWRSLEQISQPNLDSSLPCRYLTGCVYFGNIFLGLATVTVSANGLIIAQRNETKLVLHWANVECVTVLPDVRSDPQALVALKAVSRSRLPDLVIPWSKTAENIPGVRSKIRGAKE